MRSGGPRDISPETHDIASYPFRTDIAPRWSDMDQVGHLNNVSLGLIYQEARAHFLLAIQAALLPSEVPIRRVVAEVSIRYLEEAHYPHMLTVGCRIAAIGTSSYEMMMGLFQQGRLVGLCRTVFVHHDQGQSLALSPPWRALLTAMATSGGATALTHAR